MNEQELGRLLSLLASIDEWLGNSDGLMLEDVIEWRDQLGKALGKPEWGEPKRAEA